MRASGTDRLDSSWLRVDDPGRAPLELCLLYRGEPERYERATARWIARLIAERPGVRLAEVELVAAGFREAVHNDRGVVVLRECLAASTRAAAGRAVTGAGRRTI